MLTLFQESSIPTTVDKSEDPSPFSNILKMVKKQGQIHGNPAADGWAGAVM